MTQCKKRLLLPCKENGAAKVSAFKQRSTIMLIGILNMVKWCGTVLLLSVCGAQAQSAQTIESEAQLASMLCRNARAGATNDLLLDKNAQFVNAALVNALFDCASSAERNGSPAISIDIYKLTLRVTDRLNKPELAASAYYYLGHAYSLVSDIADAIQAYETSRKLFEQVGIEDDLIYVLADLGALYAATEDAKAQDYSEQSLAIALRMKSSPKGVSLGLIEYGQARSLQTLGEIELRQGNHQAAIKKLGEALVLYEQLDRTNPSYNVKMADALIAVAKVYGEMGEYGRAFSYLTKAHQVARSSGDQNTRANIMSSQASLFLDQEDYSAAQLYFNESLATYRKLGNTREEARVLLNLAVIEHRQLNHGDAFRLFQESMQRATTAGLVEVQIAAGEGLGIALTAKGDFANALNVINQSLALARQVNAKTREVELLWRAAQTYYAMQNYSESAALAEQALTLAHSLRIPKLTYLATAALGEAYAADQKAELAITTLKEAINQGEELRDQVAGRQEGQQLFFESKVGPYRALVKLLTKQGETFDALLYAERAKVRVLLESVRNNRSDLKDIYTESEKAEGEVLINKLHAINQRIHSQPRGEPTNELQNQLDAVRRDLVSFQERLAVAHSELPLRAGPAQPLTHARLRTLVPANDFAYLEYVITGDGVGAFVLKGNQVTTDYDLTYISLPIKVDELRRKVNEFHSAVAEREPAYLALGRDLYRLLIEPAAAELQNITTVCIIPDEFLWAVPFQALTNTRGHYLIQQHSLVYAPSLSVLNEMALRRQEQNGEESLIAFANPVIERQEKLKQALHMLPEAEAEVAAVAKTVRTASKRVFKGNEAEEKTFKTLAPAYTTIHLATHGVLDNRDPLNSYLLLTKTEGDPENDGRLQAREIINMHLNADLAVLSACETGNGRISPGEGVIGMSWAFLVAGAQSVVVSQWRVNSKSTSQLMNGFYRALGRQSDPNSRNKSQALREASLRLLNDRRYRHPFYWAGFVLVSSN